MITNMDGAPAGAENTAPGPVLPGPAGRTRRDVARTLRACVFAATLAPMLTAFRSLRPRSLSVDAPRDTDFDVTHCGRRIRGVRIPARNTAGDDRWHVTVDGRHLHLMRRADGTWLSTVDHYCSYRTPLEAARAAVDALGPDERLRETASGTDGHGTGTRAHKGSA